MSALKKVVCLLGYIDKQMHGTRRQYIDIQAEYRKSSNSSSF